MAEYSFDIVSKVDLTEVRNALDQAERDIAGRYDFRGSHTSFELKDSALTIGAQDEFHLNMVLDIVRGKLAKRGVSLKALQYGKVEPAAHGTVRQVVTLRQGIPDDEARSLVKRIKDSGIKAQARMQDDQVRVTGKDKDALQAVQRLVRSIEDLPYDVEFANYR